MESLTGKMILSVDDTDSLCDTQLWDSESVMGPRETGTLYNHQNSNILFSYMHLMPRSHQ